MVFFCRLPLFSNWDLRIPSAGTSKGDIEELNTRRSLVSKMAKYWHRNHIHCRIVPCLMLLYTQFPEICGEKTLSKHSSLRLNLLFDHDTMSLVLRCSFFFSTTVQMVIAMVLGSLYAPAHDEPSCLTELTEVLAGGGGKMDVHVWSGRRMCWNNRLC